MSSGKKRFYVFHEEASELGLISPEFATRKEAEAKRDEWNKEVEGHVVIEITEAKEAHDAGND